MNWPDAIRAADYKSALWSSDEFEGGPVEVVVVIPGTQNGEFGTAEGFGFSGSGAEGPVEVHHQIRGAQGIDFPLAGDGCLSAGHEERPAHSQQAFAIDGFTSSGLAGGENYQVGAQVQVHHFAGFERSFGEGQVGQHGAAVLEDGMRCQVEDGVARRFLFNALGGGAGETLVRSAPPDAPVSFEVIAADLANRMERARGSHLELAVLYARAGMREEADAELAALAAENPGSGVVAGWRASISPERR